MELEITPDPTEEERAAIAAALSILPGEPDGEAWWAAGLPGEEDEEEP